MHCERMQRVLVQSWNRILEFLTRRIRKRVRIFRLNESGDAALSLARITYLQALFVPTPKRRPKSACCLGRCAGGARRVSEAGEARLFHYCIRLIDVRRSNVCCGGGYRLSPPCLTNTGCRLAALITSSEKFPLLIIGVPSASNLDALHCTVPLIVPLTAEPSSASTSQLRL